jgi:hypothetical protein
MNAVNLSNKIYNTFTPDELIRMLCAREGDVAGEKFMLYKGVAPDVYQDLNLAIIRHAQRMYLEVDKKTNTILMPENALMLSSISVKDSCNQLHTLIQNSNLDSDIVDIRNASSCDCNCECNEELCGHISKYEAVTEEVTELMPDLSEQVFTKITRTRVEKNGNVYTERSYPIRKVVNNVWVDTVMTTEEEFVCTLEVKECGCVKTTDANKATIGCCDAAFYPIDCAKDVCTQPSGLTYNFNQQGNRIQLDENFAYGKVLVRFYVDVAPKDIRVPKVAKEAFLTGLKSFTVAFDDSAAEYLVRRWDTRYNKRKEDLSTLMQRCTLREMYSILNPKRNMV